MAEFQIVCRTSDIAVGEAKCFKVNGKMIGVYHLQEGYYAIDDPCPHAGASLVRGRLAEDVIHCRIHYWGFGVKDGLCRERNIPQHNLQTYDVRVQGDEVFIRTDSS